MKTGKQFLRPLNRAVQAHLRSILTDEVALDDSVFRGGGSRSNERFADRCTLAGIEPKNDLETGQKQPWLLKNLRKTCATDYDAHVPESSIEILGHSVGGIAYRHYAHRDPLAFRAIMTVPRPQAFTALQRGYDGKCPCCRRKFETTNR